MQVIAIKNDKIVAIIDEQPGIPPKLTLPGGRHDEQNETELDCAKRELLEETGMKFANWRLIEIVQPHTKIDWFVYTFLATDFVGQQPARPDDGGEIIDVKPMSLDDLKIAVTKSSDKNLPVDILRRVTSLQELLAYPEYS